MTHTDTSHDLEVVSRALANLTSLRNARTISAPTLDTITSGRQTSHVVEGGYEYRGLPNTIIFDEDKNSAELFVTLFAALDPLIALLDDAEHTMMALGTTLPRVVRIADAVNKAVR